MRASIVVAVIVLCACAGPSKYRLRVLLSECRQANRERARLLKEAEDYCPKMPEQEHGVAGFGEGGF